MLKTPRSGTGSRLSVAFLSAVRTAATACKILGIMFTSSLMMLGLAFVAWYGGRSIRKA